jgi:hypothetical protein
MKMSGRRCSAESRLAMCGLVYVSSAICMLAATGNLSRIFRRLTVRAAILAFVAGRTAAALVRAFVPVVTHFVLSFRLRVIVN